MPTLWETITGNSAVPVQAGNTLWDHLQNQQGGAGGVTLLVSEISVDLPGELSGILPPAEAGRVAEPLQSQVATQLKATIGNINLQAVINE